MLSISGLTFAEYAREWGWDLVLSGEDLSQGRPASWAKLPFVLELLAEYDFVLWIDPDAAFLRFDEDISSVVEPGKDVYLVEHQWGIPIQRVPNAGVLLIRSGEWSRALFEQAWRHDHLIDHPWWDNAALMEVLGYDLSPAKLTRPNENTARVGFIDVAWNSVPIDSSEDPILRHYAGPKTLDELREQLLDDLALGLLRSRSSVHGKASNSAAAV
jgi:hypothetical protein